jgi:hypothetical protein
VLFAAVTAFVLAAPSGADQTPAEEPCAKGQASDIPESIHQETDEQTAITWYTDKSSSKRIDRDAFYLYAGKKRCEVWLRLRIQFVTDKPTGIRRLQVNADGKTFELNPPQLKRESNGKLTWYWWDERVGADHLLMLFTVSAAKNATVRFVAPNRTDERTIEEQEKLALQAVLSTYRALGGQL